MESVYDYFVEKNPNQKFIFLAGDSNKLFYFNFLFYFQLKGSLDNKFWLGGNYVKAVNGYEGILDSPRMVKKKIKN